MGGGVWYTKRSLSHTGIGGVGVWNGAKSTHVILEQPLTAHCTKYSTQNDRTPYIVPLVTGKMPGVVVQTVVCLD